MPERMLCPIHHRDMSACGCTMKLDLPADPPAPLIVRQIHVGPRNGAPERFIEWFRKQDFSNCTIKEIASLAFDAGHSFWHEKNDS